MGLEQWYGPKIFGPKRRGPATMVPEPLVACRVERVNADQGVRGSGGQQQTSFAAVRDSGKDVTRSSVRRTLKTTKRTAAGLLKTSKLELNTVNIPLIGLSLST